MTRAILLAGILSLTDGAQAASTMVVKTTTAQSATLRKTTSQPATTRAFHEVALHAKLAGYAAEVKADIGDRVRKGQVLLVISVPEMLKSLEKGHAEVALLKLQHERIKAQVDVAEAEFAALDSELSRVRHLLETKSVSPKVGDETVNRHASAKARLTVAAIESKSAGVAIEIAVKELEKLEALMSYSQITAPFDGIVTRRGVDPGDLVRDSANSSSSTPLFVVAQTDTLRVRVPVPERDAVWVDKGDAAEMTFSAIPGKTVKATVSRTSGSLDSQTRMLDVEIDLPNPNGEFLPGMYGNVVITMHEKTAVIVPSDAIRFDHTGDKALVYIVRNGTLSMTPVTLGMDDGHHIEVLSGIKEGDRIAAAALGTLTDGQAVTVLAD